MQDVLTRAIDSIAQSPDKPLNKPFARPIANILADLSKPVPQRFIATRQQGKTTLSYIPWHSVAKLLDFYAPGWEGHVTQIQTVGDRLVLTYCLTIHAAEGAFSRTATGQEKLDCGSYGDPSSNAESMAFRRAAAKFGLGLSLYEKDWPSQ